MGTVFSFLYESFPPASKFSVDDIPDLTGKVVIITGGNAGLGKETAKALLAHNAKVYIAARSQAKAAAAIKELHAITGHEAHFLQLDLSKLAAVKASAEEFLSKEKELHVLFNNGGVMETPIEQLTEDGYDLQFGTNVLGHFYFTKLLTPVLSSTARSSPDGKVRVVNVSSFAHRFLSNLDFNTFKDGPARRKMTPDNLYSQSKFGNIVFASEYARRYADQGIVSTSVNPGNIRTDIVQNVRGLKLLILNYIMYEVPHGALTQLFAGTSPEAGKLHGKYLIPWARVSDPLPETQNLETGRALWTWLEEQVERFD